MAILQTIQNLFPGFKKEAPKIKGAMMGLGYSVNYDTSFEVFYHNYRYNPYIRAVINRRKRDSYRFGIEIKKGETVMKDLSLLTDLITVDGKNVNPKKFMERVIRDYEVTGNAYIYCARSTETGNVFQIQVLDPRYIKPITNKGGQVLGYLQNLDGTRIFLKDEIFHLIEDPDTCNELVGMSKITSLYIDLETDKEAKESNLAFFKNNQTPASLVILDPDYEVDEETDGPDIMSKLKSIFESGKYTGGTNRHAAAYLQGVKEIVKVQDKINESEFLEQRKFTLDLVCGVYTVNADILGMTENSNRSTGDVQVEIYYDSIEEEEETFDEFMTSILQFVYKDKSITFNAVKDSLRTLQKKAAIATEIYQGGLVSLDEGREIIGYDKSLPTDVFYQAPQPTAPDPTATPDKKTIKKK